MKNKIDKFSLPSIYLLSVFSLRFCIFVFNTQQNIFAHTYLTFLLMFRRLAILANEIEVPIRKDNTQMFWIHTAQKSSGRPKIVEAIAMQCQTIKHLATQTIYSLLVYNCSLLLSASNRLNMVFCFTVNIKDQRFRLQRRNWTENTRQRCAHISKMLFIH